MLQHTFRFPKGRFGPGAPSFAGCPSSRSLRKVGFHERRSIGILNLEPRQERTLAAKAESPYSTSARPKSCPSRSLPDDSVALAVALAKVVLGRWRRVPHLSRSLRKVGFHERKSIGILILDMGSQSPHPFDFAQGRLSFRKGREKKDGAPAAFQASFPDAVRFWGTLTRQ
jgi:hypothetical protein